jgi:hypothetical protein
MLRMGAAIIAQQRKYRLSHRHILGIWAKFLDDTGKITPKVIGSASSEALANLPSRIL